MHELTEAPPNGLLGEVLGVVLPASRARWAARANSARSGPAGAAVPDAILAPMPGQTQTRSGSTNPSARTPRQPKAVAAPAAPGAARAPTTPAATSGGLAPDLQESELRACLSAIAQQDEAALGQLYDATIGRVYGLALRITRSRESAEEVAEDVYMQVWREPSRFDPQRGVGVLGWVLMICRSRALDALRRGDDAEAHPQPETLVPELAAENGPETLLQAAQQSSALHAALAELGALQRQMLALAFFRGLTHEEIAAQMQMPLGTVKSHVRRALLALKEHLEVEPETPLQRKAGK